MIVKYGVSPRNRLWGALAFGVASVLLLAGLPASASSIRLSDAERAVLTEYKSITMCVDPDWMPYERVTQDNRFEGMVADYMALIARKIATPILLKHTASWAETLQEAKAGNCTIVAAMNKTAEREQHFAFTIPYIQSIMVIVTRTDEFYLGDVKALGDRPLVLVKGYRIIDELKKATPDLNIVLSENEDASFKQVASGEAYATIASPLSANHVIRKLGLANLKVSGQADIDFSLRTAIPLQHEALLPVFDRAIQSITREESDEIYRSWLSLTYEQEVQWQDIFGYVVAVFVAGGLIILWNYKLRSMNGRLLVEIEERRRAEAQLASTAQALQASNEKKELILSVMGHDLKNMFNAVMIYAHLLSTSGRQKKPIDVTETASKIKMVGRDTVSVLENLLEWASFDAGEDATNPEVHDLASLVDVNTQLYGPEAERKGIQMIVDAPNSVLVLSDRHMTDMVIRNLVGNAIKFTPKGGTVTLRLRESQSDDQNVGRLEVQDTGVGMSDEKIAQVMSAERSHSISGTDGEMGTGLGLALCRQLVTANGGKILVESKMGEGTLFSVILPRTAANQTTAAA